KERGRYEQQKPRGCTLEVLVLSAPLKRPSLGEFDLLGDRPLCAADKGAEIGTAHVDGSGYSALQPLPPNRDQPLITTEVRQLRQRNQSPVRRDDLQMRQLAHIFARGLLESNLQ